MKNSIQNELHTIIIVKHLQNVLCVQSRHSYKYMYIRNAQSSAKNNTDIDKFYKKATVKQYFNNKQALSLVQMIK